MGAELTYCAYVPREAIGGRIYKVITTPAMMSVPRVAATFLSPPFVPL